MGAFKPDLLLCREADGAFTLHSVIMTPDAGYVSGPAELGAPPGEVVMPELLAVTLHLNRAFGASLDVPTPMRHRLPDLRLAIDDAKMGIVAFAVLHEDHTVDGRVVGRSSVEALARSRLDLLDVVGRDLNANGQWQATADLAPPAPFTLLVHGRVWAPHQGHRACLRPAADTTGCGRRLLLDLRIEPMPGRWLPIEAQLDAVYHDSDYLSDGYDSVLIRPPTGCGWLVPIDKRT